MKTYDPAAHAVRHSLVLIKYWIRGAATALLLASMAPVIANANGSSGAERAPGIVIRDDLSPGAPPPAGILDSGINGIGQMVVRIDPADTFLSLCTGSLINPRAVIFAAHCVNSRPAEAYGHDGIPFGPHDTGTPITFAFADDTVPSLLSWLGFGPPELLHRSNPAAALYAVEQVWYDPRSLEDAAFSFLYGDVAIATLDTPAFDIPTWAMLFSPLDGPADAIITGYGAAGRANDAAIGIDFRRRSAENIISVLGSLDDQDNFLFGGAWDDNPANLYMFSFSDPDPAYNPAEGKFDFGIFGGPARGDVAREREGTTAGGDSGGPLLVENKYDQQVIAGVLSGGYRFFGAAQAFHNYGTTSFYQPLHAYWDVIVANNPYVYAGNKPGNRNWTDANHWVQLMDPNYMTDADGQLVNALPDTPAEGTSGSGAKFGHICFLDDCIELSQSAPAGDGVPIVIPGGPGSTDFVPNNVVANPSQGIAARYYDVTLAASGTTTLNSAVTIDRMTLNGATKLHVRAGGSLAVLGEYMQLNGWTQADGLVQSGRDVFVLSGLLSGTGTVAAPYVTVVGGVVAPAGADEIGTLTVDGNLILSSLSAYFVDANRGGADKLVVTGELALDGGALVMNKGKGAAPRHGDSFTIATAGTGVDGEFGDIFAFQGVLRPELDYGVNDVVATLRAGSLAQQIGRSGPVERAFAEALDTLRRDAYYALFGLYGTIDLMDPFTLSSTLRNLAPTVTNEARALHDRQSETILSSITHRLPSLGTDAQAGTVPLPAGFAPGSAPIHGLPAGVTGFVSGGQASGFAATGGHAGASAGQQFTHAGMGMEREVVPGFTVGSAVGFANGFSATGDAGRADTTLSQAAAYAAYRPGFGVYVAGVVALENGRAELGRTARSGELTFDLTGATRSQRYRFISEVGRSFELHQGLTLTPRAALGYSAHHLDRFREHGGELALQIDDLRVTQLESRIGLKVGGAALLRGHWLLQPQLQLDRVGTLGNTNESMLVRFASAPDFAFALPIPSHRGHWTEIKGGVRISNGPLAFGLGVERSFRRAENAGDRAVLEASLRF